MAEHGPALGVEGRVVIVTVIFLLSEASAFITGQTIDVDGGRAMH